jgi:ABC-2 type transport system ATP-binding protein
VTAVDGVDLRLEPGTFVGLIGHNGAGKSTCLRMLMGLLRPTAGSVLLNGVDVIERPQEARMQFGAVVEEPSLYEYLTAKEYLEFVAEVRAKGSVANALTIAGLGTDADRLIREYSQGMRRKTALAAAMMAEPSVLILDEALNGLDPPSSARVKGALRDQVDRGCTVLLSTHVVETVQAVSDRVLMLAHGRLVADELVSDIGAEGLEALFLNRMRDSQAAD